jgi:hypothetical protein
MESGKTQNEELYLVYTSPHIVRAKILRRMRWVGHADSIEEVRHAYRIVQNISKDKK